jgi:hypothetical protein
MRRGFGESVDVDLDVDVDVLVPVNWVQMELILLL